MASAELSLSLPQSWAPKDHLNIRILQSMVTGSPLYWALESECEVLVFMWPLGPLQSTCLFLQIGGPF